jgi:hypothetical protein
VARKRRDEKPPARDEAMQICMIPDVARSCRIRERGGYGARIDSDVEGCASAIKDEDRDIALHKLLSPDLIPPCTFYEPAGLADELLVDLQRILAILIPIY